MSLFYKLAYAIGFPPWENAATHRPAAEQVAALFDREQSERTPPYGRALDLGCGTGHWTVDLALRGWQVTGIELVSNAVRKARARAKDACVGVQFIQGDVTALRAAGIQPGFQFIWDFGTMHGLTPSQRQVVGREVTAVTEPSATMVVLAWAPGQRGHCRVVPAVPISKWYSHPGRSSMRSPSMCLDCPHHCEKSNRYAIGSAASDFKPISATFDEPLCVAFWPLADIPSALTNVRFRR